MEADREEMIRIMSTTEVIQVNDFRFKYVNTKYEKVQATMFDYNCDIKLKVGRQVFKAHRDVLSEASDYFAAMFGHNMKEKEQDTIELYEISPEGFQALLEYIYHGHITVQSANIEDVLEAGCFFQVAWLKHISCDFLVKHMCLDNYGHVMQLAEKYFLGDLRADIFRFVGMNFMLPPVQEKVLSLSDELLEHLLGENYFIGASEFEIYETIMKWLYHDLEGRRPFMKVILEMLRFPLMEPHELEMLDPILLEEPNLKAMIEHGRKYHSEPTAQCILQTEHSEPRGAQEVVVLMSAVDDAQVMQYKIPGVEGFFSEPMDTSFMETAFEYASVTMIGNFMFVAGGYHRKDWCSSRAVYRYDPRNHSWLVVRPMTNPRVSFSLCASEDMKGVFALAGINHVIDAGLDREIILPDCEFYDPMTDHWRDLPKLPLGSFDTAATVWENKVFLSGGITDDPLESIPVPYLYMLTMGDDSWETKTPMTTKRQGHSLTALNGKLYAFGGYTSEDDCTSVDCFSNEMYDLETEQWSDVRATPLTYGHLQRSTFMLDNKIYIIGGKYVSRYLHIYNAETNDMTPPEFCGPHYQKLTSLTVPFPPYVE